VKDPICGNALGRMCSPAYNYWSTHDQELMTWLYRHYDYSTGYQQVATVLPPEPYPEPPLPYIPSPAWP